MANSTNSTFTVQMVSDYARVFPWTSPIVGLTGYKLQPALSFAQMVMQQIMAEPNPWKWNSANVPPFLTQPYQQDYPTSLPQNTMGWLENATIIDINNTTMPPPQGLMTAVHKLMPTSAVDIPDEICWITNSTAILKSWPGNSQVYQNPLISAGGGPGNNPPCAILDPNGNIQIIYTYGTTVATGTPNWPNAGAAAGVITNDGTVQWIVVDPNGVTMRLNALAQNGSNVYQILPAYQMKPPLLTSMSSTFAPIPDDLSYLIKQGFLCFCTKQENPKDFPAEYAQWKMDIQEAMGASDREYQEFGIYPSGSLQYGGGNADTNNGLPWQRGWREN